MDQNKQAFTLIELLVVVLIIGILAAVALPQYKIAVWKSRIVQILPIITAVKNAQERYFLENGTYSHSTDALDIDFSCPKDWSCNIWIGSGDTFPETMFTSKTEPNLEIIYTFHTHIWPNKLYCVAGDANSIKICRTVGSQLEGNRYLISQ